LANSRGVNRQQLLRCGGPAVSIENGLRIANSAGPEALEPGGIRLA
jgi:hypothetical protein